MVLTLGHRRELLFTINWLTLQTVGLARRMNGVGALALTLRLDFCMGLIRKSLWRAWLLTANLYLLLVILDGFVGDQDAPLLKRFPLAWILYWPKVLLSTNTRVTVTDVVVSLLANAAVYAIVI